MVLGNIIVGDDGHAVARHMRRNKCASLPDKTGPDLDVVTACVQRYPNGLLRLDVRVFSHRLCLRESNGLCLGGVWLLLQIVLYQLDQISDRNIVRFAGDISANIGLGV